LEVVSDAWNDDPKLEKADGDIPEDPEHVAGTKLDAIRVAITKMYGK
jgi:hypothetical protein